MRLFKKTHDVHLYFDYTEKIRWYSYGEAEEITFASRSKTVGKLDRKGLDELVSPLLGVQLNNVLILWLTFTGTYNL